MKYITNIDGLPVFYAYQRNNYKNKYFLKEKHRAGLSDQYRRPYQPGKIREYRYKSSPRANIQRVAYTTHKQDFIDWRKLLYQITIPNPYKSKVKTIKKPYKATFELLELKTDGRYYEFLMRDCIKNNIVTWGYLPNKEKIKEFLKQHPFPEDAIYSEKMFWEDFENKYGYISLVVEKRETAEFICNLCCALIIRRKISRRNKR